jgi:signal peptidase I
MSDKSRVSAMQPDAPAPAEENPWLEWLKTLGLSLVLAVGIRQFIVESRFIPSESMVPTLLVGDRLLVEKVSYYFGDPQRGDIVVFSAPAGMLELSPGFRQALIKRVVAVPGDTLEIRDGVIYINDQVVTEDYVVNEPCLDFCHRATEVLPEDAYMVLGDNRNRSHDGRAWGYISRDDVIGRAWIRIWPPERFGAISPRPVYPVDGPTAVKPAHNVVQPGY